MIVVDVNVLAYLLIEGEHTERSAGGSSNRRSAPTWRTRPKAVRSTSTTGVIAAKRNHCVA